MTKKLYAMITDVQLFEHSTFPCAGGQSNLFLSSGGFALSVGLWHSTILNVLNCLRVKQGFKETTCYNRVKNSLFHEESNVVCRPANSSDQHNPHPLD